MNDRFKFRAWNKEDKKMYAVEGVYAYKDECTQGGEVFLQWFKTSHYFPEQVELMQCTGLKDKNGKLIYEGDIVQWGKTNFAVVWQSCQYALKKDINEKPIDFSLTSFNGKGIEVIGNIYENKELLNES